MAKKTARDRAEWLTDKYILVMLLAFPLFTGWEGYRRITLSKFLFFAAATGLWLALLLLCFLRGPRTGEKRPWPPGARLIAAFLLWACASALLSPYGSAVLLGAGRYDGLVPLLLYGLAALGTARFARPRRLYVHALAWSTAVCCLLALLQLRGLNPLGLYPHGWNYYDGFIRYTGTFLGTVGNTVLLSALLSLTVPLLAVTAARCGGRDVWLLLPAALGLYVLLRSGGAAGPAALLGTAWLAPVWLSAPGRRRRVLLAAAAGLLLAGLAAVYFWPGRSGTVWEASRLLHGELSDSFGSSRVRIWRAVLAAVPARPLWGGGPGTVALRIDVVFSRLVPETGEWAVTAADNAHSEYLGYLADLGVPGLCLYLAAMAGALLSPRRRQRDRRAWGCALLAYWIQALFGLGLCLTAPLLWIAWGLFISEPPDGDPSGGLSFILLPPRPGLPPAPAPADRGRRWIFSRSGCP